MRVVAFNQEIFDVLVRCGFRYCYAKTVVDEEKAGQVNILLTPVGPKPNIRRLPVQHDTYYKINQEPKQMADGIDADTAVLINLNDTLLKESYGKENTDH